VNYVSINHLIKKIGHQDLILWKKLFNIYLPRLHQNILSSGLRSADNFLKVVFRFQIAVKIDQVSLQI